MIVAEKRPKAAASDYDRFGEAMPDGRLTEHSDGKKYRLRDAIILTKRLGRPLSEEEMKQFEI